MIATVQSNPIEWSGAEVDPAGGGYVGGPAPRGADLHYWKLKVWKLWKLVSQQIVSRTPPPTINHHIRDNVFSQTGAGVGRGVGANPGQCQWFLTETTFFWHTWHHFYIWPGDVWERGASFLHRRPLWLCCSFGDDDDDYDLYIMGAVCVSVCQQKSFFSKFLFSIFFQNIFSIFFFNFFFNFFSLYFFFKKKFQHFFQFFFQIFFQFFFQNYFFQKKFQN